MATKKNYNHALDPTNDDFGLMINCAVRYAIGRRTYVPSSVIGFITPLLSQINDRTLHCLDQDIVDAKYTGGYGDACDERDWMRFHDAVKSEKIKRGKELYIHWREREELFKNQSLIARLYTIIGSHLYVIEDEEIWKGKLEKVATTEDHCTWFEVKMPDEMPEVVSIEYRLEDFGKIVFESEDEAQSALKKMRNDETE